MPVMIALFSGLFGLVAALVGAFVFDIGLLASVATYIVIGGIIPFSLISTNVEDDGTDFVERRAVPRGLSY